jgi:hypothetical protein
LTEKHGVIDISPMALVRISALIILCFSITAYAQSMPVFFTTLYLQNQKAIDSAFSGLFGQLCAQSSVDPLQMNNRNTVNAILFFHQLLTTTDAVDCTMGGILKTVYFWHWTDPNPRYTILLLPDSIPLIRLPPPEGYKKYKSY